MGRGIAHSELEGYRDALVYYDKVIALAQELGDTEMQAKAYLNRGIAHSALEEHEKAIADYDKAIELGDAQTQAKAYFNRSVAHNALKEHRDALADSDKAEALGDTQTHRLTSIDIPKYDKAIALGDTQAQEQAYVNRGASHQPISSKFLNQEQAYFNRGNARNTLKEHRDAIVDSDKAIALAQELGDTEAQAQVYFNRGNAHNALKEHRDAITDYNKAIELGDAQMQARAYFNKGIAHRALGARKDARTSFHKAVDSMCEHSFHTFHNKNSMHKKKYYKFSSIESHILQGLIRKDELYFRSVSKLNDPLECPILQIGDFKEAFKGEYEPHILSLVVGDEYDDDTGIPKAIKSVLMFSHYADEHKGICIEYELEFPEEEPEKKNTAKIFYTSVQYGFSTKADSLERLFAIKSKAWNYEHEERFVAFGEEEYYPLKKKITKIIFGLKTCQKDQDLLYTLLKGKKENKKRIAFYKTETEEDEYFTLQFTEISEKLEERYDKNII